MITGGNVTYKGFGLDIFKVEILIVANSFY